jgi:Tol biopolymer transport system component
MSVSSDRTKVAFVHNGALEVLALSGGEPRVLLQAPADLSQAPLHTSWSPDDRSLAYVHDTSPGDGRDVFVIPSDASSGERPVAAPGFVATDYYEVSWSPDSTQLLFAHDDEPNRTYAIHVDGTGQSELTSPSNGSIYASWSPDGSAILYQDREESKLYTGGHTVYVRDLASGTARAIGRGTNPKWSPTGKQVAFTTPTGITVAQPDGTNPTEVMTLPTDKDVQGYNWSPDGTHLVYIVGISLGVVAADGSGRAAVTTDSAISFQNPVWIP